MEPPPVRQKLPMRSYSKVVILVAAIFLAVSSRTFAFDEFADLIGKPCVLCHADPEGGGARNKIGQIFEEHGFMFPVDFNLENPHKTEDGETEITVEETKPITISGNIRTAYLLDQDAEGNNTFFVMKSELAVIARPTKNATAKLSYNLGQPLDAYGQVEILPLLTIRVGQFELPFGRPQRDHNILIRQHYQLGSDVREIGMTLSGTNAFIEYALAVTNGNVDDKPYDRDGDKGVAGHLAFKIWRMKFGASGLKRQWRTDPTILAAFFFSSVLSKKTFFEAEINVERERSTTKSLGLYCTTKYRLTPKFSLAGRYENLFLSAQQRRVLSVEDQQRLAFAFRYKPYPLAALDFFYWANFNRPNQALLMWSLWF